jgi:hypothetical protein
MTRPSRLISSTPSRTSECALVVASRPIRRACVLSLEE